MNETFCGGGSAAEILAGAIELGNSGKRRLEETLNSEDVLKLADCSYAVTAMLYRGVKMHPNILIRPAYTI